MVKITAHLGVELAQDVTGFGQVELVRILPRDNLRGHAELLHDLLIRRVVVLVLQEDDNHLGVPEDATFSHVVSKFTLDLIDVLLVFSLDVVRLLNTDFELVGTLLEAVDNRVGQVVTLAVVDENPFLFTEVHCFLDWQAAELILIALDDLVAFDELRRSQHIGGHLDRVVLNLETPVSDGLLLEEL